jgi:galactonate dehydratase
MNGSIRLDPIKSIEAFVVAPGWTFARCETEAGFVGWGEGASQTYAPAVARTIEIFASRLIGEDANAIENAWELMTKGSFFRGGPILGAAVAAVDIALWDIAARRRDEPLHRHLGGPVRERVRVYGWCGWGDDQPEQLAVAAGEQRQRGYDLVKLTIGQMRHLEDGDWFEQLRVAMATLVEIFGKGSVALDCHGRCTPAMAQRLLRAVEPFEPLFVEEPVLPEFAEALARLAASSAIPIATGERLYSRWDAKDVVQSGVAILQPDVAMAGGITETRRIAALADTWGLTVAPHCAVGPLAVAASLQLCLATTNATLQELDLTAWDEHVNSYLIDTAPLTIRGGYVEALSGPGLGIDIDEEAVREASAKSAFRVRPTLTNPDGSFAEW